MSFIGSGLFDNDQLKDGLNFDDDDILTAKPTGNSSNYLAKENDIKCLNHIS